MLTNNYFKKLSDENKRYIIYVDQNIFSNPEGVLKPLRELLSYDHSSEGYLYVYSQLGYAHLLLSEYKLAEMFYHRALKYDEFDECCLANLAHASFELDKKNKAVHYGRLALQKRAELVSDNKQLPEKAHNGRKNIIAYSLYGGIPKYCETAILNVDIAKKIFPEYICRFYTDDSVPNEIINRLKKKGAEIHSVSEKGIDLPGQFWRFLSLDDPQIDRVLVRDADSILDQREVACVNDWTSSDKEFHIIRDSCSHTELILAGLFGVKAGIVRDIYEKLITFKELPYININHRYSDQLFLRHCIWPIVNKLALTHDNLYKFGHFVVDAPEITTIDEPSLALVNDHMGANYAFRSLKVDINIEIKESMMLNFMLYDQGNNLVCNYNLPVTNQRFVKVFLPLNYILNIEKGLWHYAFEINSLANNK